MGKYKEKNKLKSRNLHTRMTESEFELAKGNCQIAGYRNMSKFIRDRACYYYRLKASKGASCQAASEVEELLAEVERLQKENMRLEGLLKDMENVK